MPVGLVAVIPVVKCFADLSYLQMASSMLQNCILATVIVGCRVDVSGETIPWKDLACMRMLETISKRKPGLRESQTRSLAGAS